MTQFPEPNTLAQASSAFSFNPLDYPAAFTPVKWLPPTPAWTEHTPFAQFLVTLLRGNDLPTRPTVSSAN